MIGEQIVDVTPMMHTSITMPTAGELIIVQGTKPDGTGVVSATALLPF